MINRRIIIDVLFEIDESKFENKKLEILVEKFINPLVEENFKEGSIIREVNIKVI